MSDSIDIIASLMIVAAVVAITALGAYAVLWRKRQWGRASQRFWLCFAVIVVGVSAVAQPVQMPPIGFGGSREDAIGRPSAEPNLAVSAKYGELRI